MAAYDDFASLRRLRSLYDEALQLAPTAGPILDDIFLDYQLEDEAERAGGEMDLAIPDSGMDLSSRNPFDRRPPPEVRFAGGGYVEVPYEDGGAAFPPDQFWHVPDPNYGGPPAQVYAEGGTVDFPWDVGSDDYGSGRITRTPAERREARERRISQWAPPSPADDWGAAEWDRFGARHHYNPLSYGMEALGRIDSAGRGRDSLRDIWDVVNPNPDLYGKTGNMLGAFADVASIASLGLGKKLGWALGAALPITYDLGYEGGKELLGHAEGGDVAAYREGGRVAKAIRTIANKFGSWQGARAEPALGYVDLINNGRLKVFPTESGFGSLSDITDNPLLTRVGRVGDLDNATANDAFRVVHDALGHFGPGNPFFRHQGEERAWQAHGRSFSRDALPAATSETRGQNSWVNFGPYGERNRKASGADTTYADQKVGLLPEWVWGEGFKTGGVVDTIKKAWKTRKAESLQKEVEELNAGRHPSEPFVSPDIVPRLQTVADPERIMFPGIYKDPRDIIEDARSKWIADPGEEGAMFRLFGHTRHSLDDLSQGNRYLDAIEPPEMPWDAPARSRGSKISDQVLTRRNAGRVQDVLDLALSDPELRTTRSWYELSPLWDKMNEFGLGEKVQRGLNTRMGVMSPGSDPPKEINRGFFAHYLAPQGRTEEIGRYGVMPMAERPDHFPEDLMGLIPHPYTNTAHMPNLRSFEETGELSTAKHKVPTYIMASDPVWQFGGRPVADAHFTRFLGYPDVRTGAAAAGNKQELSPSEYGDMLPWWRRHVANELDLRDRDAQALMWNVGGPQTGVSYIGPPKLEMISNQIDAAAKRLGIPLEEAAYRMLSGESPGFAEGGAVEDDMAMWGSQNYAGGGAVKRIANAIRAYHGSPHDFDKFDASKIGTGEGAQAYGHGLYFAEAEPVAESYLGREADWRYGRAKAQTIYDRLNDVSNERNLRTNEDWDKLNAQRGFWEKVVLGRAPRSIIDDAVANPDQYGNAELAFIKALDPNKFTRKGGHMYEVDIHEDPSRFLNWDVPLGRQHSSVIDAARSAISPINFRELLQGSAKDWPMGEGYDFVGGRMLPKQTSEAFGAAGIPGIRYLDQFSRPGREGTSNYVIFPGNEDLIDIRRKYAAGGAVEVDMAMWGSQNYADGGAVLRPVIRGLGKVFKGRTHLDALEDARSKLPMDAYQSLVLDGDNRLFQDHRGRLLDRFDAQDYAKSYGLHIQDAPEWARTGPELISEYLRIPEEFSTGGPVDDDMALWGSQHL